MKISFLPVKLCVIVIYIGHHRDCNIPYAMPCAIWSAANDRTMEWMKEGFESLSKNLLAREVGESGKLPSIGHIGSTLWIMTMSMYDSCSLTSEACTDSIMCFRDSPRPSLLSRMVDIINLIIQCAAN